MEVKAATPITEFSIPHEWSSQVHDSKGVSEFFYPICKYVQGEYKIVGIIPMDLDFESQVLERVFMDLVSKGAYSEVDRQQIARAKEIISPAYQLKIQEDRDRAAEEYRARKQAAHQLALAA